MDYQIEDRQAKSWPDYVGIIDEIKNKYGRYRVDLDNGKHYQDQVRLLYRGQSNENWSLMTTLERKTNQDMHVLRYLQSATNHVEEIESFTSKNWGVPDDLELEEEIKDKQETFKVHLPCYNYLVYLRHHGFPSPLLDWSESPYIAAYFAFISCNEHDPAVYCYIERSGPGRGAIGRKPQITLKGPYVKTHIRHYAQKAWYTIATQWNYSEERHDFVPHKEVFNLKYKKQDLLIKIILPASIRKSALENMNEYNINHFTLFQSEDSLIKAIETKVYDLK